MNKTDGMKNSPYGDVTWLKPEDAERLIYVYKEVFEDEAFKPPAAWFVLSAFDGRIYIKSRSRVDAQRICDCFFESVGKYKVIPDKTGSVR